MVEHWIEAPCVDGSNPSLDKKAFIGLLAFVHKGLQGLKRLESSYGLQKMVSERVSSPEKAFTQKALYPKGVVA